jgi:hypothetical protein
MIRCRFRKLVLDQALQHFQFVGIKPGHLADAAFIQLDEKRIAIETPEHLPPASRATSKRYCFSFSQPQLSDTQAPLTVSGHRQQQGLGPLTARNLAPRKNAEYSVIVNEHSLAKNAPVHCCLCTGFLPERLAA